MATQSAHIFKISLTAGSASLATKQYYFVKLDTDGTAIVCSGATDIPVGVLQNNPAAGGVAEVLVIGLSKVNSDAALSIGNLIGTSADGQADAKTSGTDTTEYVVGRMLTATGAAGVIGTALINCASPHRAA